MSNLVYHNGILSQVLGSIVGSGSITVTDSAGSVVFSASSAITLPNSVVQVATQFYPITTFSTSNIYTGPYNASSLIYTFTITPNQNNVDSIIVLDLDVCFSVLQNATATLMGGAAACLYPTTSTSAPVASTVFAWGPTTLSSQTGYYSSKIRYAYSQTSGVSTSFYLGLFNVQTNVGAGATSTGGSGGFSNLFSVVEGFI